ncbi:plasmid partitioning protein RepA [Hyphomicrobiales bacterium BP6-180914]|uniref:Plasmid partitioning protein RepA n=1 Tax=Lichenifustis flavocetrariae TaxID=2949735 RepID=A0AA41Z581_9HYPH|nr:plasmid partitioning protein RepA [Lichenifustis flavocetrariae]MCW6513020.1 plasmid partitioning protein RepA [Lichenifustis flavocetrariae]
MASEKLTKTAQTGAPELKTLVQSHGAELSAQLRAHHRNIFPPEAEKSIRPFTPAETAKLLGIHESYLRQVAADSIAATLKNGRRSYTVQDIQELRKLLDQGTRGNRRYLPHRQGAEHMQVITIMNFKGGSGKTTTSAHLAQHLALQGYRVLAVDLDPQASLSALFGHQPETHVGPNETLYGAIRYEDRRPMAEIVRGTYIPGLHIVPGNLELMEFEHDTPKALMGRQSGDTLFFARIGQALGQVQNLYDVVVIDCPPQLGYLTLSALTAATAVLITVHPQMLDVMSMSQFLQMTGDLLDEVSRHGASTGYDWMKYLITRFETGDGPQNQMVAFLRSIFGEHVLIHPMLKSTAISDAGLTNQTIYEVERNQFTRATYDRALEAVSNVNTEIEAQIRKAWGRA